MNRKLIQIFAKNPIPGSVKTRLIPQLGAKGACEVYRQILRKTILNTNFDNIKVELWLNILKSIKIDEIFKINKSMQLHEQKGYNLGDKMYFSLQEGLERADKVVLVGSDCPQIKQEHYVKLFNLLKTCDLALIPACDGGYVAIGAQNIDKTIFNGITWSSNTVYQETINKIKAAGLSYKSLKPLRDLDIFEDYQWHLRQNNIQ